MKQKDIAMIMIVVFISGVISYAISASIFNSPKKRQQKVEVVDKIETDFQAPDTKYFNAQSLNPTQTITIGDNPNTRPFNTPTGR